MFLGAEFEYALIPKTHNRQFIFAMVYVRCIWGETDKCYDYSNYMYTVIIIMVKNKGN